MIDFEGLVRRLAESQVKFIVVGGFAGTVLGSPRTTIDLDVVSLRQLIRLKRAAGRPRDLEALAELEALLEERDHPSDQ